MNEKEYHQYILAECEREWDENQKEFYGPWSEQSDDTKADYYNQMYSDLSDNLIKCCEDCRYGCKRNKICKKWEVR